MGHWHARALSAVVVVTLAGGPTLARLCEAMCVGGPLTSSGDATRVDDRLNAMSHAVAGADHADAHADHRPEIVPAASAEAGSMVNVPSRRHCGGALGQWRALMTAARTLAGLVAPLPAADLPPGVASASLDRRPRGPTVGRSPGASPSARTPLVLRI